MVFPIAQFVVLGLLVWCVALLATGGWRRQKRVRELQCRSCGYPIAGLTSPQCPECGGTLSLATIASPADPRPTTLRFVLNCVGWVFASGFVAMVGVGVAHGLLGARLVERHLDLYAPGFDVVVTGTGGRSYKDGVGAPHKLTIAITGPTGAVSRTASPDADPRAHEGLIREMLTQSGTPNVDVDGVVFDIANTVAHLSGAPTTASGIAMGAAPTPTTLGAGGGGYSMIAATSKWSNALSLAGWLVLLVVGEYCIYRDHARRKVVAANADKEIERVMSGWGEA